MEKKMKKKAIKKTLRTESQIKEFVKPKLNDAAQLLREIYRIPRSEWVLMPVAVRSALVFSKNSLDEALVPARRWWREKPASRKT